jgi:hypothetical protein
MLAYLEDSDEVLDGKPIVVEEFILTELQLFVAGDSVHDNAVLDSKIEHVVR